MLVLTARYMTKPEDTAAILDDLAEMTALVRQHEPGCLQYQVHQGIDSPHELLLYEAYQDQASFDAHGKTPYFQEIVLGRIVPKLVSRQRDVWTLP